MPAHAAQLESALTELQRSGSRSKSACGKALLDAVSPLIDSGVLQWTRSSSGRSLAVADAPAFNDFLARLFPGSSTAAGASRIEGVARFRNSKALKGDTPDLVVGRFWRSPGLLLEGRAVESILSATEDHGVFAFALRPDSRYELKGRIALVENPAVLLAIEKLPGTGCLDGALYAGGRISSRVLDWLARHPAAGFQLVHFPDYDPVGLQEYLRLRRCLGARIELHVPPGLPGLFERYANRTILRKPGNQARLAALRKLADASIAGILALICEHNAVLEQEALLVPAPPFVT